MAWNHHRLNLEEEAAVVVPLESSSVASHEVVAHVGSHVRLENWLTCSLQIKLQSGLGWNSVRWEERVDG